jgi:outer membrane receptor for ferrienterochelin and colicin
MKPQRDSRQDAMRIHTRLFRNNHRAVKQIITPATCTLCLLAAEAQPAPSGIVREMRSGLGQDRRCLKMIVLAALLATACLCGTASVRAQGEPEYFDMSLTELLSINVYSASRSITSIAEAPSVMTVVTAEDISKQGLKTLEEVLQRVPGFFATSTGTRTIVGNRGVLTGNILLLIDGHPVNSIIKNGFNNQHIFPLLDNIERIEVIRGPGSTLWGADAALGVINIITRSDMDPKGKMSAKYDYAATIERHILKVSLEKGFGNNSGFMLTGNFFESDPPWINKYRAGQASDDSYVVSRDGPSVVHDFNESYELYGKLKLNSFLLSARITRFENMADFLTSTGLDRQGHFEYENDFIDAKYNLAIGEESEIDFRVFYDRISDHSIGDVTAPGAPTFHTRAEEEGLGGEVIYTTTFFEDHKVKAGSKYRHVDVKRLNQQLYRGGVSGGVLSGEFNIAESGTDNTLAFFAEDTWHFADRWIGILGGRIDYNDFRDDATLFLPRCGLIWETTDRFTLKYLYNTGYIRPSVQQSLGTGGEPFLYTRTGEYWVGANQSEKVSSHDFQVLYNYENVYLGATLYHLNYENYIEWPGVEYEPGYRATFQNIGDITSQGIELDFRVDLFDSLTIYGNCAYNRAQLDSMQFTVKGVPVDLTGSHLVETGGSFIGAPEQTWNLGVNYNIIDNVDLNVHYRGWSGIWSKETNLPKYKKFGAEDYVDLNLRWRKVFNSPVDLSVYCKNLFDTGTRPDMNSGSPVPVSSGTDISGVPTPTGVVAGYGRIIGLQVGAEF